MVGETVEGRILVGNVIQGVGTDRKGVNGEVQCEGLPPAAVAEGFSVDPAKSFVPSEPMLSRIDRGSFGLCLGVVYCISVLHLGRFANRGLKIVLALPPSPQYSDSGGGIHQGDLLPVLPH